MYGSPYRYFLLYDVYIVNKIFILPVSVLTLEVMKKQILHDTVHVNMHSQSLTVEW